LLGSLTTTTTTTLRWIGEGFFGDIAGRLLYDKCWVHTPGFGSINTLRLLKPLRLSAFKLQYRLWNLCIFCHDMVSMPAWTAVAPIS